MIGVGKVLFGKVADSLEKGAEHEDEYIICEKEPVYIHPKRYGNVKLRSTCGRYSEGVLDSAGFPAVMTAHFVPMEGQQRP